MITKEMLNNSLKDSCILFLACALGAIYLKMVYPQAIFYFVLFFYILWFKFMLVRSNNQTNKDNEIDKLLKLCKPVKGKWK